MEEYGTERICRPDSLEGGPIDGVQMKSDCVRTDFIKEPNEGEPVFSQTDKREAHISASVEIGIFSIRDMESGVMLTISLSDAVEVVAAALDAAKEVGTCIEKASANAGAVVSE